MELPNHIAVSGIAGQPIQYLWGLDVSRAIRHPLEDEHPRLAEACQSIGGRGALALLLAVAEWVAWRYAGIIDIRDACQRIEAGYSGVLNHTTAVLPEPSEPFPKEQGKAHGPLKLARMLITEAWDTYRAKPAFVAESLLSMVLLARHVVADHPAFEAWLSTTMRRTHALCPATEAPPPEQVALPPQFFAGAPADSPAQRAELWDAFLATIERTGHPYLTPPADGHLAATSTPN